MSGPAGRPIVDPATEREIARVPDLDPAELDRVVERAAVAARHWGATAPRDRGRALARLAALVEEHGEQLARLETANVGKTIRDARADVQMVADTFAYFAGAADKRHGAAIPTPGGLTYTVHEPLGVAGLIVPWNFPIAITAWKLAPALACGNAAIVKPAELTPLSALRLAELAPAAGLPEGLVAVVPGAGAALGEALVDHPEVPKISFTGSTAVGRRVMARAAAHVKRLSLELGGKSANVVFADADLELAAREAPGAVFLNAGQNCCARSRILVQRGVVDRFVELFAAAASELRVGPPSDEATDIGPLISAAHRERVAGYVDGDVAWRGAAPAGAGHWFAPTLLGPMGNDARAAREEIFGPVACVIPFDDEADAVAIANDTPYGLSGSVWTRDGARALRMAAAIQAGVLSVNSHDSVRVGAPFGGFKGSGFGRELGLEALDAYSEVKSVFVASAG